MSRDGRRLLVIGLLVMGAFFGFSHGFHPHGFGRWPDSEDGHCGHHHHHRSHGCEETCGDW